MADSGSLQAGLAILFAVCLAGIVLGTVINLRSVRAGAGPSALGIAINGVTVATFLAILGTIVVIFSVTSQRWIVTLLAIIPFTTAAIVALGTAQTVKRLRRPS